MLNDCPTELEQGFRNLNAYPVWTQDRQAETTPSPAGAFGGGRGTGSVGAIVEQTLRNVLGWRPRVNDPRGLSTALNQAFSYSEVGGRGVYTYVPRSYAAQVQADMGALTGAQASIYARAKVSLEQCLILLDRVYKLDPAGDPENIAALKAIVRSHLTDLVNELGLEGGPRVERVDTLFESLIGECNVLGGQMKNLEDALGFNDDQFNKNRVNTIAEEQNYTDFLTIIDYCESLKATWDKNREYFGPSTESPFLGTQAIHLSRAFAVLGESVEEVNAAFDSVFLGPSERHLIRLDFRDAGSSMSVGELLDWIHTVATVEGPQLVQEGGKLGVKALVPVLKKLEALVTSALNQGEVPEAYKTPRVQTSLNGLLNILTTTYELADSFSCAAADKTVPHGDDSEAAAT
ncbi:MAG: hypothetical protein RKK15_09850 [Defluviicoccus sp.]|nr:hypothetical protein [Defluviicoccus sp.]